MESKFQQRAPQKTGTDRPNLTGIPTQMKLNFEQQSGMSFDDVRVHYGSDRPAQLRALAYTQGRHVYIGPGQERHLGHELGHVVQQKLGQVAPTGRVGGLPLNDDWRLETEADHLAALADRHAPGLEPPVQRAAADPGGEQGVVQMVHPAFLDQTYSNADTHRLGRAGLAEWNRQQRQWWVNHAAILRASLVGDSLIPDPSDYVYNQAHHIVETNNNPLGKLILRNARIHPDSAVNGVLLPSVYHDEGGDASIHRGSHHWMYGACVTTALWNAIVPELDERWDGEIFFQYAEPYDLQNVRPMYICSDEAPTIIEVLAEIRQMLLEDNMPLNNSADETFGEGYTEQQIYNIFYYRGLL